jgi:large subunit ribosomal protein L21
MHRGASYGHLEITFIFNSFPPGLLKRRDHIDMYSVIETGGLQHKVSLGETLKVPKIDAEIGSDVTISKVLLLTDGKRVKIGAPLLEDAGVKVEILFHGKDDKIRVFKKKRRKGYRKTYGHRQQYTEILVKEFIYGEQHRSANKKAVTRAKARIAALSKLKTQDSTATKKAKSEDNKGE